jgi:anti-sigma B factor antagonist
VFSRALGKVVVHIHGALDSTTAPNLKDRLVDIIDSQGNRQVVVDLRGMTSVDLSGLLVLVDALKRMDDHGGELVLSGPTRSVVQSLRAAGFDEAFTITPVWTHPARGGSAASRRWEHDSSH